MTVQIQKQSILNFESYLNMKAKNKPSISNSSHFDPSILNIQQSYMPTQNQNRQVPSKAQKMNKTGSVNQSMDTGIQQYQQVTQKMGDIVVNQHHGYPASNAQYNLAPYDKNYAQQQTILTKSNVQHMRSGSQVVNGNTKVKSQHHKSSSQYQEMGQMPVHMSGAQTFDLSPAQIAQLNYLSHNQAQAQDPRIGNNNDSNSSDRIQNQKVRRKNNMSQHIVQNSSLGLMEEQMLLLDNTNTSSKREASKMNSNQLTQNSTTLYESLRQPNNHSILNQSQQLLMQTGNFERFNTANKNNNSKKAKVQANNQIILPAGALMQGVPQLKQQLNSKHISVTNSAQVVKNNISISNTLPNQSSHQRIQSLQDSNSVASNMARGFNSASNAAMLQQAQIMQIYQQQSVNNIMATSTTSSQNKKNSYNQNQTNSRKIIPQISGQMSNQNVHSRDKDAKNLIVDSFANNYQTYNQTYGNGSQIQVLINQNKTTTDSNRMTRINGKDNMSDQNHIYNHTQGSQVLTIPQKKMKQQIQNKTTTNNVGNNSVQQLTKNQTYIQQPTSFFENNHTQAMSTQQMTQALINSESSFDNRPHSKGGQLLNKNPNFTPLLPQSMKQTINNNTFEKSDSGKNKQGNISQQIHVRHTSMHLGEGSSQSKKMSIQHRKNKTMLNNQIRINPALQQNMGPHSSANNKVRQSYDNLSSNKGQKINMYDNYADLTHQNFYTQNAISHQKNSSQVSSSNNLQKGTNMQSSHRKNKSSIIAQGNQKMQNINSSSAFYPISNFSANMMAAESQPSSTIKQIMGGTITQSHKSLRQNSSSRKRTGSKEPNLSKKKSGTDSSHQNSQYADLNNFEINQYAINSKHKPKKSYGGIKPQGNIVIQQQEPLSQHEQNLINAKANRRQSSSILKDEHQSKQMIYIDNDSSQKQNIAQRFGNQTQQYQYIQYHRLEHQPDQESEFSMSSVNKTTGFVDGGTGAGKIMQQHQHTRQSQFDRDNIIMQYSNMNNKDYSQADTNKSGYKPEQDIDNQDISIKEPGAKPDPNVKSINHSKKQSITQQITKPSKPLNLRNAADGLQNLNLIGFDSINITQEALALGKVPPELIADMIKSHNYTLKEDDGNLSPRTKEMIILTNIIRKSFKAKGVAPKTTPEFYRAGKMLGRGAFGKVSLGMHKLSRKLVALKSINKEYMNDEKQKSKVMHEVGILLRLRHQSVVKLYETFETKRHMLLSMELCAGGDLLNYVRKRKKLDEVSAKIIFKQIIQGLGYIHRKRILHRDIKLDNILLDGKGNVKIADFGVSKLVKPGDVMHEQSGTPAYIAPEILREQGYTGFKADIWSAGVVLYAMLCGTVPFKASNMKELHKMIMKGKYHLKEEVSDEAKHLLKAMLDINPKTRISVSKILEHPWLKSLPQELPEIFNEEEKAIVKREFIYNNPNIPNRSEQVNPNDEPWDCFTELNLDSINQTLRNESEKSVILAPFNSSLSDYNEDDYKGMEASLIIHRLFDDAAPLEDKKDLVRFAARCRDQDRQYEINNNGELDNGVYHKFVYSSRDGGPDPSSSLDKGGGSVNDLRPQSSRNAMKPSGDLKHEIAKRVREGKQVESEATDDYGVEDSKESLGASDFLGGQIDENRIKTLTHFGYPEEYIRFVLLENESCYCLATYLLLGEDQRY